MTNDIKLPPFDTAALGALATCRPDLNSRLLHAIDLQVVGTGSPTAAEYIEYIQVNANNEKKLLIKPAIQALFDSVLNANSDTLDTTFIRIPFTQPGFPFSPWGTKDVNDLTVQVKVAGTNPSGKTLTKIQGWYGFTPLDEPRNLGPIFQQTVIPSRGVPFAGWNEFDNLPVGDVAFATRLLLNHPAITEVKIWIGDELIYDKSRAAANEALRRNPMYKAQNAGSETFFFVALDQIGVASDFHSLMRKGVRRPVKVEYYWDNTITVTPVAFDTLFQGVANDKNVQSAVASSKA